MEQVIRGDGEGVKGGGKQELTVVILYRGSTAGKIKKTFPGRYASDPPARGRVK
jgi:hypothetical protein